MRKELLGRMFRTAAMIMIISMLAGACSKNNGPEKPEDNTGQTTGPGGNGYGDQGNSGNEGGSGDEGGNEGGTSGGDHGGSGDSGSGGSGDQGDQPKPQITANSWMTAIDDDTKIAMLTIPGTHDAATSTCAGPGKCQTLTISGQLEHGVRAFDLRPTMDNNSTLGNIYHSILDTGVSMEDAMKYFDSFLKAHPGEGIIVIMRYESERQFLSPSIAEDNYKTAMKNFLWDSRIYQSRMAAFNRSMTMKDLRGKILIISRNDLSPVSTFETAYTQWSHSNSVGEALQIYGTGGLGRIYVQDMYSAEKNGNSSEADFLAKKKELVCKLLDITVPFREYEQNNWVINYCSGYAGSSFASDSYAKNAASTNPAALEHIQAHTGKGFTGIVMMDYAGTDTYEVGGSTFSVSGKSLTEALIMNNFQ
ncbi:MAG: hypothetical protein SPF63_04655 [Candidatus Cryptobacteroides sp.]|nr:hypothetical protein [Candidatus Cryptobacteroides sp.]